MNTDKQRLGYLEGTVSSVLNIVLFGLKLWAGIITGSVAMIADAWHTLSDTLTSLVVIFGFWVSSRPEDRKHPFGHGRAELIASMIIGILLAVVGVNFLRESIIILQSRNSASYTGLAITIFLVSTVLKEMIARFSIRLGKKTASKSLIADGWHHRSDAMASGLILVGAWAGRHIWWIDSVLGIGVSLLILYTAFEIVRDAADSILGEEPSEETVQKLTELTRLSENTAAEMAEISEMSDVHHIHIHRYGEHTEITLHVRMPGETSLYRAHAAASILEEMILDHLGFIATVHPEPLTEYRSE